MNCPSTVRLYRCDSRMADLNTAREWTENSLGLEVFLASEKRPKIFIFEEVGVGQVGANIRSGKKK